MSPGFDRLGALVAAVRSDLRRRSAAATLVWAGAGVLALWLVAWLQAGSDGWRPGTAAPLVLVGLMVAWLGMLGGLFWSLRRRFDDARLSSAMERATRLRAGEVRGALELSRGLPPGVSSALAGHAAERAARDLTGRRPRELSGELGAEVSTWTRRGLTFLTLAAVVVVGVTVLRPARSAMTLAGLLSPIETGAAPAFEPLRVMPGTADVPRGSDVQVRVFAEGRASVEISWQEAGDVQRRVSLEVVDGEAVHVLPGVDAETEYTVRSEAERQPLRFVLTPVDPLFVGDLLIDIEYPHHTGLPDEQHRMSAPPLQLPAGTRILLSGRTNRALESVELVDGAGSTALGLDVDGLTFEGQWTPLVSGTFSWSFVDGEGGGAELLPDPLRVEIVPDAPPVVDIPVPGVDTLLPLDGRQPLVIEAFDDWGLDELELISFRAGAGGQRGEPVVERFDLGGSRGVSARPLLDVSAWRLMPGDTVRYFARVRDNGPGRQVAETREYVLLMPSATHVRRDAERALEEAAERVEELGAEAGRLAEENRARAREGRARRDPPNGRSSAGAEEQRAFEEGERMRQALQDQEGMNARVDSIRGELAELGRRLEGLGQADPELRRQLEQLEELLREASGPDLQNRMSQLAESLERGDAREAARSLEQMAEEQQRLRERLEQSLDRFRRAAVEQDFRATTSEAQELARQERALSDALREDEDPRARVEQQRALADRAEELDEVMERLESRLRELGEEAAADGVDNASRTTREARTEMEQAASHAEDGQRAAAAEQAEGASEQLERAAAELDEAQRQMSDRLAEAARAALERTVDDALALARRQADLRAEMRGAGQDRISALRPDEASLLEGLGNMSESFRMGTQGQVPGARDIVTQMGRAMESVERTLTAMERPRAMGSSPVAESERVIADLNDLALLAMASADRMSQDGQGETLAGEQNMQQALEELAQQQGDLVNQAGQIMPMQLGQQAMAEQSRQLSEGQQSISDQLGDLGQRPDQEGALGDLQQLAAEAAELAAELARGRLTPETAERQERLFHRLLDAGRSLEREEFSDEREADAPGEFERAEVVPLDPSQLGILPYRMPDAAEMRALSPAVRQLILQYFERLNRSPGNGDP